MLTLHGSDGAGVDTRNSANGFVCPRCRNALDATTERYHCPHCRADYPIVLGIPDFRLEPDPWIDIESDRAKGERLARETEGADFETVVRAYWAMTPSTPKPLAEKFIRHVLNSRQRSDEWLAWMLDQDGNAPGGRWLEIGCGTGDLVVAALSRGIELIGIDIAFRWLVVASRRPELATGGQQLVCCNAEHLPFADATYARVVSAGTLEHCGDATATICEATRVLRCGSRLRIRTVNRYTLLREPHVGVWGVGFVPRRWSDGYVRLRSQQRYLHHHPLSRRELGRKLRRAGLTQVRVLGAALLGSEHSRLPSGLRWISALYSWARRTVGIRSVLGTISPALDATGVKP